MSLSRATVTRRDDRAVVALRGEHEAMTAERLRSELVTLLDEKRAIEVDLTHATFIDSTTIGVLIDLHRRAEARGLSFSLKLGPETGWPVRRVLEVTRLGDVLSLSG
jgi:anti-sigma B factor antagonist